MYSTISAGPASQTAPQGLHLYRAEVAVKLAIKQLLSRCLNHLATISPSVYTSTYQYVPVCTRIM